MVEYLLLIGICGLVILFAGPSIWKSIENHFGFVANSIENADGSGTGGEDSGSTDPKADPVNGTAFAVYSDDDQSLNFYKRDSVPEVGDTFNGRKVTAVFSDLEEWDEKSAPFDGITIMSTKSVLCYDSDIKLKKTENLFEGFENLEKADLRKLDVSQVTNMDSTFDNCKSLSKLDISNWDVSKVQSAFRMFYNCKSLSELDISNWNTSSMSNMSMMIYWCKSLKNIDLSRWNTSNVSSMYNMFMGCSQLKSVGNLSDWDVSNVTAISSMFYDCDSLTDVGDLSGWDVSNVTDIHEMFSGCESLKNVGDLSGWNTSNVKNMRDMFYRSGITIPSWYKE